MNILDILLAIPLGYFIFKGWRRGLIYELAALAGIIIGCWAATHLSTAVAETLSLKGEGAVLVAFFITFVGAIVLANFLGKALEKIVKLVKVNFLNKLMGALLGMVKCLCVLSVLLNFILLIDRQQVIITPKVQEESILYAPTYKVGNKLTTNLRDYIHEIREKKATNEK